MNASAPTFLSGMVFVRMESSAIVKTSVSIPRSDVATMPMSFKSRSDMTKVRIQIASLRATQKVKLENFGISVFGNHPFQARTVRQAKAAKETSKSVMAKGAAFNTTYPMAIAEKARKSPEAAKMAEYRFTENERKSMENPTMASTATMADKNVIQDELEKMRKPKRIVNNLHASEYGANTPARSLA